MTRTGPNPYGTAYSRSRCCTWRATVCAVLLSSTLTGCSIFMAANQPSKKDLDLMRVGTPRALLIQEFGNPVSSREAEGCTAEVFSFVQGYSSGAKASRVVLHGAADLLTAGLWEVVGTPTEATFNGEPMHYEVTYDENDKVATVVALKE